MIKVLIIFLFSNVVLARTNCNHERQIFRCVKFIKNYDADTITVEIPGIHPYFGQKAKVRVFGVDTPEKAPSRKKEKNLRNCEVQLAKRGQRIVEKLLRSAKQIDLKLIKSKASDEKYGRILADVIFDGHSLKKFLLDKKLAYPYFGKTKKKINWCEFMNSPK